MKSLHLSDRQFHVLFGMLIALQIAAAFFFCIQKQGFHYDEYYSYYSSNVTYGLVPSDGEWKNTDEIRSEFMVEKGNGFQYGRVIQMQTYDVHPPFYYLILHTICSLTPDTFSKWQGLSINLVFYLLSIILLSKIAGAITNNNRMIQIASCLLYGFAPAVISGVVFIRMYMMLTFFCKLFFYLHCRMLRKERMTAGFYIQVLLYTFLGFMTHYYFLVFLFFISAFIFLWALSQKKIKSAFAYAGSVAVGGILGIILYPACLSHIFSGYRGTEAKDAFFTLSNFGDRISFFGGLINDDLFGGLMYFLLLLLILLMITVQFQKKRLFEGTKTEHLLLLFTVVGYFLIVAKTALMNAEEAIRYEMPIYGLIILLSLLALHSLFKKLQIIPYKGVVIVCTLLILMAQIAGLCGNRVCFLFKENKDNVLWAEEQKDTPVVYLYNATNIWMIWDDSEELMVYPEIYFLKMDEEETGKATEKILNDKKLQQADTVYVYAMRGDNTDSYLKLLQRNLSGMTKCTKIGERGYCDIYQLQ